MKKLSRAKNTMRNTLWGAIYRVATLIGPFAIKTIIIKELGQEYNGLSTLFTSVLTVLNLANLGFNSSLVFTMYKAIAEDDKPALCAMLKFYRKVYRIVGLVILAMAGEKRVSAGCEPVRPLRHLSVGERAGLPDVRL